MLKNGIENTNTDIGMIIIPSKNVTIIKFNKYSLFTFFHNEFNSFYVYNI